MGRLKSKMELMRNPTLLYTKFKKRKAGLLKQIDQLTVLCDVKACMIIGGPKEGGKSQSQTEIWPEGVDEFSQVVNLYRGKPKDKRIRLSGISDFFEHRKRETRVELKKLREMNREMMYPSWIDSLMSHLPETKLREFGTTLNIKVDLVESRIKSMKLGINHYNYPMQNKPSILNGALPQQIDNSNGTLMQSGMDEWLLLMNRHRVHQTQEEAIPMSNNSIPIHHDIQRGYGPMNHYYANVERGQYHCHRHHRMHVANHNSTMMGLSMDGIEVDHHRIQNVRSWVELQ